MSPTSYRTAPPRAKVNSCPGVTNEAQDPDFKSRFEIKKFSNSLVGLGRFELPTSRLSGVRSNQLSYRPITPFCRFYRKKEPHFSECGPFQRWTRSGPCSFGGELTNACDLLLLSYERSV